MIIHQLKLMSHYVNIFIIIERKLNSTKFCVYKLLAQYIVIYIVSNMIYLDNAPIARDLIIIIECMQLFHSSRYNICI